jgi:MFS family permease
MIDFSRAFNLAWERTLVLLFRPFDLGRWLVIGFSAFLAGLLEGGNGVDLPLPSNSYNFSPNDSSFQYHANLPPLSTSMAQAWTALFTGFGIFMAAAICCATLALIVLLYWLGARGQFLLLDNIVRNRPAVSWPWRAYARPGNNLFVFILWWVVAVFALLIPLMIAFIFAALPYFRLHRWPDGAEWAPLAIVGLIYLVVMIPLGLLFFLFREFGIPLMFRNGLTARAALVETWRLLQRHRASVLVFVLLRIALVVGMAVVTALVCCLSCCCFERIPCVGTILLLPAIIYIKCFTLDCLAQFGPEYDVWTVDLPPGAPSVPPVTLPPPPG